MFLRAGSNGVSGADSNMVGPMAVFSQEGVS